MSGTPEEIVELKHPRPPGRRIRQQRSALGMVARASKIGDKMTISTKDEMRRYAFVWRKWQGGAPREAWFVHHWPHTNANRECSHCGSAVDVSDPCWVGPETGYVLCEACAGDLEVTEIRVACFCADCGHHHYRVAGKHA